MSDRSPADQEQAVQDDAAPGDEAAPSDETAQSIAAVMRLAFRPGTRHANEFGTVAADLVRRMSPRDPVEEMLLAQMVLVHTRAVYLSHRADREKNPRWFTAVSAEADRALQMFRRQVQALADYRRPRRGNSFTAIRHADIQSTIDARRQQVVHAPPPPPPSPPHLSPAAATPFIGAVHAPPVPQEAEAAVPPVARRVRRPASRRPADPAVARQHRPADDDGQVGQ